MASGPSKSSRVELPQYRGIYLKRIPTYSFPLMLEVMAELGVSAGKVLNNTGTEAVDLVAEDSRVSFLQALKFIRNLLRHSPRQDIGLYIGERYHISTYGILGYAMMACANWADALVLGRRFHRVASSLVDIELETDPQRETISYLARPFYPGLVDIEPFTVEKLFASLVAASRSVLPAPAQPDRITVTWDRPAYADRYTRVFGCPVEFGCPENRFEIDRRRLQQPLFASNEVCAAMGRRLCEEHLGQIEQSDGSCAREVTDFLLANPGVIPGMEAVARSMGVSGRTLRRRLREEGTTFHALCDEVRHDLSRQYLRGSQLTLDEIAHLVGFTESTNFRRAFKRWQGVPPARYRRELRDQALSR